MKASSAEVAGLFRVVNAAGGANLPAEVYPGYPALVIAGGELRQMTWGFPLPHKSKATGQPLKPKPVNNARADKLESFFWRGSFASRRCLIPVTAFAEAEGEKGKKTRTWFSVPDEPVFACAGVWRQSDEWGAVFSMVMTDASPAVAPVHDRMPVILAPDDHAAWMEAKPAEALELCRPYAGELEVERSEQPWSGR